jgi:hypothetical protein
VPRRICYAVDRRRCERPGDATVRDLELHGSRLALISSYGLPHTGGNGQIDVRMELVSGGRQRLMALANVGESGQTWIGPSWANGDLFFYQSCFGSGCGPGAGGPYRYDPGRRAYSKAGLSGDVTGLAMDADGRHAFLAFGTPASVCTGDPRAEPEDATDPCFLRLTGPLTFRRTRPPIATEFRSRN